MQNQLSRKVKNLVTALPLTAWIFVFILSVAPILVGITQAILTDWPDIDPLSGKLMPPLFPGLQLLLLFVGSAMVLGIVGWSMVFIPTTVHFQTLSLLIKITALGILLSLTLLLLWFEIIGIFLVIFLRAYNGLLIGGPVTPTWVMIVGWIWSSGTILFITLYFSRQFVRRTTRI